MKAKPYLYAGALTLAVAAALSLTAPITQANTKHGKKPKVPVIQVDPTWPKMPLPSSDDPRTDPAFLGAVSTATGMPMPWVTGEVAGTCVDSRDHVFIVTRGNLISPEYNETTGARTAVPAPPVIEFNKTGGVANAWGDRNVLPNGIHGCFIDYQDNIWIAGNGDGIVQKYSHGGTLLLQIGMRGVCDWPANGNACGNSGSDPTANQSKTLLNEPANMYIDPKKDPVTGERGSIYIADGYGNHRIVVFDAHGNYLRQWGGVAGTVNNPVTDFPALFGSGDGGHPHCVTIGKDELVYVCDRQNDRIQVFTKTGVLKRVMPVVPGTGQTLGIGGAPGLGTAGSAWDLAFTKDSDQTYMFEVDGGNEILHTMDRLLGKILADFGQPGHQAGQFTFLHSVVLDSKGNVYTGETINGRRVQKFTQVECNEGKGHGYGYGNCD
jgi:NHL repeat